MTDSTPPPPRRRGVLAAIGPAIITASVVLGPGSILSASKIGHDFQYQLVWVLAVAVALMIGMTALSARLGVVLDGTLGDELARRAGRPVAALTGITIFLIASCFQFGNNLGILAGIEPLFDDVATAAPESPARQWAPLLIIVNLNLLIVVALFGFRALYRPVERMMKFLVALMMIGFAGNLILARPDLLEVLRGFIPSLPERVDSLLPRWEGRVVENAEVVDPGHLVDHLSPLVAMIATTFSVAAAFYQSYLVREKGWTRDHLRQGLVDSAVGISVLGLITLMILVTAGAVLHGNPQVGALDDAADVARQLEPAFGWGAKYLFCLGIFAGAFSSFLVNAMIGGSMLADGFGLGGSIDQRWPKLFTVLALAIGMNVALITHASGQKPVNLIIFAQALTVLGLPILAGALLWLATRRDLIADRHVPLWMKLVATVGLLLTIYLAVRQGVTLYLRAVYG